MIDVLLMMLSLTCAVGLTLGIARARRLRQTGGACGIRRTWP